jgi:alkylation response protein AidB-like acyl-CoA dehydrogenase
LTIPHGQKMWASNEGIADLYCVVCKTDPNLADEGVALIYVPKDAKGLTFGKNERKAGMAADKNHPMFLENVRVPKEWRAAGPGADADLLHNNLIVGRIVTAAMATGQAQAVFDIVMNYTADRVVGNKPIRQHSLVANMLADMAIGIERRRGGPIWLQPGCTTTPTSTALPHQVTSFQEEASPRCMRAT